MSILKRFFGSGSENPKAGSAVEQAVLVHLDEPPSRDELYEQYDLATLEEELARVISEKHLGEYDGNEFGPGVATLYMYGPDAERLFQGIESTLRGHPVCQGAQVVVRSGPPGSSEREIRL